MEQNVNFYYFNFIYNKNEKQNLLVIYTENILLLFLFPLKLYILYAYKF